jgi:carbon-monoxide dehydrogenase medium subunit
VETLTEFVAPQTVDEAVAILRRKGSAACVLAGGTDVMVRVQRGQMPATCTTLVSLHNVDGLHDCSRDQGEFVVGAAVTASDLIRNPAVVECAPILSRVADRLASTQVRNLATIGGNLANASPAGDLINPLLLLDARLVLVSEEGRRTVPVEEFFTGPGETVMRPDELLVEVRFDAPPPRRVFRFEKAGTRPSMECSVVTVGLAFTPRDDLLTDVRVAFGSSAPIPLRGKKTEQVLEGQQPTPELAQQAARAAEAEVTPISDVRGSDCYRRALVGVFLKRLLNDD